MLKVERKVSTSPITTAIPISDSIKQLAATFALGDFLTKSKRQTNSTDSNQFDDIRKFNLGGSIWVQK